MYKKVRGLLGTDEPLLWGRWERRLGLDSKKHSKEFTLYSKKKKVWGLRSEKHFIAKKKKKNGTVENGLEWEREQETVPSCLCFRLILPPTYPSNKLIIGREHFIHLSIPTAQYRGGLNKSLLHK